MHQALERLRARIHDSVRRDESLCVAELIAAYQRRPPDRSRVGAHARQLVEAVRAQRRHASGVDHLMHEFSLSSEEGVALMCVAEALLRIPDADTADRLIRDKLARGAWGNHLGGQPSMFVSAATWGLLITGKLVATRSDEALGNALTRLIARCGEPVIRKGTELAMQLLGRQFVMGETIAAALERSRQNVARAYTHSFDMLGEAALTSADAERYFQSYLSAIEAIGRASRGEGVVAGPGISVKLSALHPRYTRLQRERVMRELHPKLLTLAERACDHDISLTIDAEEADRLELSLDLFEQLVEAPQLAGWQGLGFVVQAYQKRAPAVVDYLVALARAHRRRLMVRLVKGAYWDSEIKRAQVDGLVDYPVFTRKFHSDLCYLVCAGKMLDAAEAIYPQFATHNAQTLAAVSRMAVERKVEAFEFQCLHGMGESLYDNIVGPAAPGRRCRIYAPVGSYETLLPYLVRRLLENGSNSSFVNQIVDEAVSVDSLVADPVAHAIAVCGERHPRIPVPPALFGAERQNSRGFDFADERALAGLARGLAEVRGTVWTAAPVVAGAHPADTPARPVLNPANRDDVVGSVVEATAGEVGQALSAASAFAAERAGQQAAVRAACLRRCADLLEKNAVVLISLAIREAGKTRVNAVAEVREAVDFCRYYAQQAQTASPRPERAGPVICISPWNFPLAIFVGQVAAALVAGHAVIAKPAGQTPLIAALAVRLFHEAGVPAAALQFLPGRGEVVGNALVADARIAGVVFTGSLDVACRINRVLADHPRETFLVAETGGLNAMVVDSSAHLEQVVQDVIASAFDSAGQRCSALRLLCVQDDIAGRLLTMLKAAMQELCLGDPDRLEVDVGPVIDAAAQARLLAHVERLAARGGVRFSLPLPAAAAPGSFVAPTLLGIDAPEDVREEVFGPVLHVLRFRRAQLGDLVEAINANGYGLTFGIQSRIEETIDFVVKRIRAGNVYVNRNMIGAVVGVQPFGGEGLSGTGPKAGGPLYLARLSGTAVRPVALGVPAEAVVPVAGLLAQLNEWALNTGRARLAQACCDYRAANLAGHALRLPGPAGEANRLSFVPRGQVACRAGDEAALLEQIAAVLATGNVPLLADDATSQTLLTQLPGPLAAAIVVRPEPLDEAALAGVLFAGSGDDRRALAQALAARAGEIVPLLVVGSTGYPVARLVKERVVSVNTAAAGGDTGLMMLGD
ncbi:bifunctional proline dehydrogenase/L-glutamate gamma-semialdehyde dehydrogenase PutA [uncultured Propionivibrio sp.]|uniref:bifunctional proline dehydrogenase/L-glutamate gamma-semialdehyde dehydrogenase PutA n=1 Tax=uncultured Propionivibrio sp. TaxID=426737 RepID=UPI0029BFC3DE|nr:bifunctional proline dehydrogenase/L-glutamate gamma-semialdehyde dehydrogenase PutA [uncultured Propionivibrio sp.]